MSPTFVAAKSRKILVNDSDLSSYFREASVPYSAEPVETTTYGDEAKTFKGALKDGSWSASGFLDESTAGGAGTVIEAALGQDENEISDYGEGDAIGKHGFGLLATVTAHEVSAPVAGVVEHSAEASSSRAAERIVSHHALGEETTDGTASASVDNAGSSTAGGVGYLHVTSIAGGTLTVKLQDSTDDSTFADLITFTVTEETTSERKTVTGQVDRHTRSTWALTGGSATFQVGLGRTPHNI